MIDDTALYDQEDSLCERNASQDCLVTCSKEESSEKMFSSKLKAKMERL